jgi:hypothetical protein
MALRTITLKTFDSKSICFQYTPGTGKTIDDITNAINHSIGYRCTSIDRFTYRLNRILYSKYAEENFMKTPEELFDTLTEIRMARISPISLPQMECDDMIILTVNTLARTSFSLIVTASTTVEQLKYLIQDQEDVEFSLQNLIYNGKSLQDENTLESYGIVNNTDLFITLRLKGGMFSEVSGRGGSYEILPTMIVYNLDTNTRII